MLEPSRGRQPVSTGRRGASARDTDRLLDRLPAGAYTCDAAGLITCYNRHAVRLWGRAPALNAPADRFCGSFKLYSPDDGPPNAHDQCWMALALREQREYSGCEIVVERPDGQRLTVLAHADPIHDDTGRLIGAVNVPVDIDDRKRAEQALREAARAAVRGAVRGRLEQALGAARPEAGAPRPPSRPDADEAQSPLT